MTRAKGALAYDDRIDVLSMAVAFWSERMAQDVNRKMANRKAEMLDSELERFMENAVGRKPRGNTWM